MHDTNPDTSPLLSRLPEVSDELEHARQTLFGVSAIRRGSPPPIDPDRLRHQLASLQAEARDLRTQILGRMSSPWSAAPDLLHKRPDPPPLAREPEGGGRSRSARGCRSRR